MPRTEESNQRIREEQRKRILDAARKVFAQKGFTDTKMNDVAMAAGVSYGLAYHYFTNKEELFTELMKRALQGYTDLMQYAENTQSTPWDRLSWLVSQIHKGAQEDPEYEMLVLQALTNAAIPQEVREMVHKQARLTLAWLKQQIAEGQAAGQIVSSDPDRLATLLAWCIQGVAMQAAYPDFSSSSSLTVEDVMRVLKP